MTDRTCQLDDCGSKRVAGGYCDKHYRRWRKTGDPTTVPSRRKYGHCAIDDCLNDGEKLGMCAKHYRRWSVHGDPLYVGRVVGNDPVRFAGHIVEGDEFEDRGPCWLWTSSLKADGYASFGIGGTSVLAHRWSYEYHVADIPNCLEIDHLCRVRHCVNPYHLDPVTHEVNIERREESTRR